MDVDQLVPMPENSFVSEEQRERTEHNNAVLALRTVFALPEGLAVFKFLFKTLEVNQLPPIEFKETYGESWFMDKIGSLRAGRAIFELASEASPTIAGTLLAQIEKEKYDDLMAQYEQEKTGRN